MFLKQYLTINKDITIIGKYDKYKNTLTANDIKLYKIGKEIKIEPIYHVVYGISSKVINNYINEALKHVLNESIINREIIDLGVVLVTYSNGVKIVINYSNSN